MIVKQEEFNQPTVLEDGIIAYPWHIDTKYYTADVQVCAVERKTLGSPQFIESVQAVVVHFDSRKVWNFYYSNRLFLGILCF